MISDPNRLIETFKKMNADGFDTENYLKWGFYFLDGNKENLLNLFGELSPQKYSLQDLSKMDDDLWQLHITKVDILTLEALHNRNLFFNQLAIQHNIQLYDGWDVERME